MTGQSVDWQCVRAIRINWFESSFHQDARFATTTSHTPGMRSDVAGGSAIGQARSEILGRGTEIDDVIFGLSLFCWWPFKPDLFQGSRQYILDQRWNLFGGASVNELSGNKVREVIPMGTLELLPSELFFRLRSQFITELIHL